MSFKSFIENSLPNLHIKAEAIAPQSSYIANGVGFTWGAITFNQWAMGITLILGIMTFLVNFYFQCKRNARERAREARENELHKEKMRHLSDQDHQ